MIVWKIHHKNPYGTKLKASIIHSYIHPKHHIKSTLKPCSNLSTKSDSNKTNSVQDD